jgi:hypothetical protein
MRISIDFRLLGQLLSQFSLFFLKGLTSIKGECAGESDGN